MSLVVELLQVLFQTDVLIVASLQHPKNSKPQERFSQEKPFPVCNFQVSFRATWQGRGVTREVIPAKKCPVLRVKEWEGLTDSPDVSILQF